MEKITLKYLIAREIDLINMQIDKKILKGKSYYKEAQKHRALLVQYRRTQVRRKTYFSNGAILTT